MCWHTALFWPKQFYWLPLNVSYHQSLYNKHTWLHEPNRIIQKWFLYNNLRGTAFWCVTSRVTTAVAVPTFQTISVEDFSPHCWIHLAQRTSWPEAAEPEPRLGWHSPSQVSSRWPSCLYTVDTAATHSSRTPILLKAEISEICVFVKKIEGELIPAGV